MEIFITSVLVILGLILIALEVLFLPGLIVGILGGLLILIAMIYSTLTIGIEAGIITIVFSLVSIIILFISFKKLKVWDRFVLKDEQKLSASGKLNYNENEIIGKTGIALTDLRPSGFILIDNKKIDAQSNGEFIPKNSKIEIISVEGSKVKVKKLEETL
jgi:membrane-bound ClpP family serine protease